MANAPRSTDYGTVILHVLLVGSFAVLVATGLRIATDDPETEWLLALDLLLPTNNLWLNHLSAGVVLAGVLGGYAVYMRRARLGSRVRLDRPRLMAMLRPGRARWGALNVLVYWILIASLVGEVVTGTMLFFGAGRAVLELHRDVTFVCLASVAVHVGLHAAFGGLGQLVRVLRPAALVVAPEPNLAEMLAEELARRSTTPAKPPAEVRDAASAGAKPITLAANPFITGLGAALVVGGIAIGGEQATRATLRVVEIPQGAAPRLDGELSDPVWAKAPPVSVLTSQGGDFGGTYQSLVEIRAVHDADYAYFAFVWEDPTRSLKHHPLVKGPDGWEVAATREDLADEKRYNEDKLAVLLTRPGLPLIGGAIHLARAPLSDKPSSSTERGLHFTDGGIADIWQWRASHGGPYGHVDNCHFGGPQPATAEAVKRSGHYAGGFAIDPGPSPYGANVLQQDGPDGGRRIVPRRLPIDARAMAAAMGRISEEHGHSESEGARWWMTMAESRPYTREADATLPVGTIVPGVVMADVAPMGPDGIRGVARWSAGRWTLELARRLYTGSAYDVPIKTGVMMWVAAFDHAEKRHTRHLRPFRLEVD